MPPFLQALSLFIFLRDHPLWNPEFKRFFGRWGIALVIIFQVLAFVAGVVFFNIDNFWWYPLLAWFAFIVGTAPACLVCYYGHIIKLASRGRVRLSGIWVSSQVVSVVLLIAFFFPDVMPQSIRLADPNLVYLLFCGSLLMFSSTQHYWNEVKIADGTRIRSLSL